MKLVSFIINIFKQVSKQYSTMHTLSFKNNGNRSAKKVVESVLFSSNLNKKRYVPKLSFPTFAHKTSLRTFQATYFQRKTRNKFKV